MNGKNKVLIVDDDATNIAIIEEFLEDEYILETAATGEEALEILAKFCPDLILLDIMMPGIDGYEVCQRIRADERFRFIKIIMVSGKAMLEECIKGYDVGADDYVTKPFDDEELLAKVRVFVRLKKSEEVDQIKSDLLALFSHETRTPLNGILGSAQLLRESDSLSDEDRDYVEMILESGNRLLEFVDKASFLCQLKAGIELSPSSESVDDHLMKSMSELEEEAAQKEVTFKFEANGGQIVNADWSLLDDVFTCVIDNAVKFSPTVGEVRVRSEINREDCFIRVSDQGEGIRPEWVDGIFDEFASRDMTHHQKGQGLSLAICRHILEYHGGTINVESTPGNGATFVLRIPIQSAITAPLEPAV